MELHYDVRGADGKEYGPVTLEQLSNWVRERRLIPHQEVKRSDMEHWAPAGSFTEFQGLFNEVGVPISAAAQGPGPAGGQPLPAGVALTQIKSSGSWFYWIAGLSLINSFSAFSGQSFRFLFGLGITQLLQASLRGSSALGLLLSLVAAGVFVGLGVFATKGQLWAFIVGMVLFALDGLIFLMEGDWLGVGFHAVVLFFLVRGVKACLVLKKM